MTETTFTPEFWSTVDTTEKGEHSERVFEQRLLSVAERFYAARQDIGRGRSGLVWTASAPEVHDRLCFKTIHTPGIETNTLDREFFLQEEAERLEVRVPKVFGYINTPEHSSFGRHGVLVMEHIEGRTLQEELEYRAQTHQPWSYSEFVQLGDDIEEQLQKLHDEHIYHRDLHFKNLMVTGNNKPVLIDFGRARKVFGSEDDSSIYQGTYFEQGKRITQRLLNDDTFRVQFAEAATKLGLIVR